MSQPIAYEQFRSCVPKLLSILEWKPLRNAGSKLRKAIRKELKRTLGSCYTCNELMPDQVFSSLHFDPLGTWVWFALAKAIAAPNPATHRDLVIAAFDQTEAGLSEEQLASFPCLTGASASPHGSHPCQIESEEVQRLLQNEKAKKAELRAQRDALAAIERQRKEAEAKRLLEEDRNLFLAKANEMLCLNSLDTDRFVSLARDYAVFEGQTLTLSRAVKLFGMTRECRMRIEGDLKDRKTTHALANAKVAAEKKLKREWEFSLIPSFKIPEHMGITKTEYQKWLDTGMLKSCLHRDFRKWGVMVQFE